MMPGRTMILILAAVAFSALGQIFLKAGAQHLSGLARLEFLLAASRDPYVLSGIAAWGVSTICWLHVLQVAPLSRAYLLSSLTYVLIPVASVYVFGEQLRLLHVVGMVLILMGVTCLVSAD
jgi:multidrug transporter EmrE-like cation transporter